jgi:hypothetical protein
MEDFKYTVIRNRTLDENLERFLSPMDELEFLSQLDHHLPKLHQSKKSQRFNWLRRRSLRLYRGLAEWCGIHFYYIEFDNQLHILRIEPSCDADLHEVDTLLGEPDGEGVTVEDVGHGISIASY